MTELKGRLTPTQLAVYNQLATTSKRYISEVADMQHVDKILNEPNLNELSVRKIRDIIDKVLGKKSTNLEIEIATDDKDILDDDNKIAAIDTTNLNARLINEGQFLLTEDGGKLVESVLTNDLSVGEREMIKVALNKKLSEDALKKNGLESKRQDVNKKIHELQEILKSIENDIAAIDARKACYDGINTKVKTSGERLLDGILN